MGLDNKLLELGGAALVTILFLREIFGFIIKVWDKLAGKEDPEAEALNSILEFMKRQDERMRVVEDRLCDLYDWHNVVDGNGVRVWYSHYGTTALEKTLDNLGKILEQSTEVLRQVAEQQRGAAEKLDRVEEHMKSMEKRLDGR